MILLLNNLYLLPIKKKQLSLASETACIATSRALTGAAGGALFRGIAKYLAIPLETRLISARSFAVESGIRAGMICAMKGIRGKDDTKARAVAGFTSGFLFYLVGNIPFPHRVPRAIGLGLICALGDSLMHEVDTRSQRTALEDTQYTRTRCMLSELGLQDYEKHFKKQLLRDETMPWLKERKVLLEDIMLCLCFCARP
ncbi:hypothetical protein MKW98_026610 [Papaver atlanticum]|uniref:Mitochondrial inner membrane translocase subunit Tim17/Tim22/Tim23/peroxisomal protein PMP24 n=1 Tax=Papaver atlanticum TaxID=357466 RepID=A0AAD4RZM0_9MAGN|nr:hypothetical protein MKW98_026610 [Papaver atlanticum]